MAKKAKFHGLDMIPVYLDLSGGQLQEALDLLQSLEECRHKPYVLDDNIVMRVIKQNNEQKELLLIALNQCAFWRDQNPTQEQLDHIEKIEQYTKRLQKTSEQLLFLANHYKDHTIDRILEKSDAELAVDFLMGKLYDPTKAENEESDKEPLGPESSHDFKIFHNPNEGGIQSLYKITAKHATPSDSVLAKCYKDYVKEREMLNSFHDNIYKEGMEEITHIAKELGNYDVVEEKAVIQNDSEMNVFYDYLSLYRLKNGRRFLSDWLMRNPNALTEDNKSLVSGYNDAKFSVLRIDKNLSHGAIQVVDIITQKPHILIDKALNASNKKGCFFCCSIIDRGDYVMTTGGGILIDGHSLGGKAVLTIVISQLDTLKGFTALTPEVARSVRKIYGFCLRNGALSGMTSNQNY